MLRVLKHPLTWIVVGFFLITSWPFVGYPLTDGDTSHWVRWAQEISQQSNFLSAKSDQSHGPILVWGTAVFLRLFSLSFYTLNLFNLLCGLGSLLLVYMISKQLGASRKTTLIATLFTTTNFMWVYLSRTPMYDLPAAFGYTLFCYAYAVYLHKKNPRWLVLALMGVGLGTLSRFIIVIGLSGFFIGIMQFLSVYRLPSSPFSRVWTWLKRCLAHGFLVVSVALVLSFPWLWVQHTHHDGFLKEFMYDNFLRFLGDEKGVSRDYYGFLLITFIALIPTTPVLVAGLSRSLWQKWGKSPIAHVALAASLPCLMVFSFSGHTKLIRYIAYIFPSLLLLSGHIYTTCIESPIYRRRMRYWYYGLLSVVAIVLSIYAIQFNAEAQQSGLFVGAAIVLLVGLIGSGLVFLGHRYKSFMENPLFYLLSCCVFYLLFFTVLAIEYNHVPFLKQVHDSIENSLGV
jgi:4-amino-4-deoxy-L-arabinose transferase-like glycosyltransferase